MSTTPTPETTAVWNRHLCLTPEITTDLLELCMKLERQRNAATTLAGELIAMIRVNVMRGTFSEATTEEVDKHLKPWIDLLAGITGPSGGGSAGVVCPAAKP